MPKFASVVSVGALVVVTTSGCGGTSPGDSETSTDTPTATGPARPEQAPVEEAPVEEAPAERWAMPDLVGSTLQDAQDQIQSLTGGAVFHTASHDLTGQGRSQVLDSNWKVCTQNVEAGAPLTTESEIDFGAVKLDERCP